MDREELAILEFLIQPQPKEGYGVFGGGWERPANVFMAAKAFNKQLKQQADHHQRNGNCGHLIALFSFFKWSKFSFALNPALFSIKSAEIAASRTVEEETPAQAEARANASMKMKMERLSRIWNWVKEVSGSNKANKE